MVQSHEDALVEEILNDAGKKAGRTARRSEREGRQAVDKAEKEAESILESASEAARARAEKEKAIVLATVDLDSRRMEMDVRERLINEAFDAARKRMFAKQTYDYVIVLTKLVASAIRSIEGDSFRIALAEVDRSAGDFNAIRKGVFEQIGRKVELKLDDDSAPIRAGAIIRSGDGRRMVDNSFEGRLARMHDVLRREVAKMLFGETKT